ncbi:MAG: alpha-L-fucosidase [Clostridiales bacterium]|nr:alpha-L-fucosidase [Clostridiales bacterium]
MYEKSWNSLRNHQTPQWLMKAKFGIYTHWGIYSVPACKPNGSWYGFYMYQKGSPQYEYHIKTYGPPEKFGYKDFIPMFTGEKFDPQEWAALFKAAGAKFAGPVGEHHDGFSMWDTTLNPWNSKRMGPGRDVVGELARAIRAEGMKYMVALHHAENWRFFPHWIKESDLLDPKYYGLYGSPHNLEWENGIPENGEWPIWNTQAPPDRLFCDQWLAKCKEIIDKFHPDLLWFDFGLGFMPEAYKKEMVAYYYNEAKKREQEVALTYKFHDIPVGTGLIDLEQGRFNTQTYHDWITDTTIDDGEGWCYLKEGGYKSVQELIHYLVDNVSKNGYFLLNVGPKPDGEIPQEAKERLLGIGRWLEINGEAIYDTVPWVHFGEGPTKMKNSGMFSESEKMTYCSEDIRFTCRDNTLFAILLDWPKDCLAIVKRLAKAYPGTIRDVTLLGSADVLEWEHTPSGLFVKLPSERPCQYAYVLKIIFNDHI